MSEIRQQARAASPSQERSRRMEKAQIAEVLKHAAKGKPACICGRLHMFVGGDVSPNALEAVRVAFPETHWERDGVLDTCAHCGDFRRQHHARGCGRCGYAPWERGQYRCTGFKEAD